MFLTPVPKDLILMCVGSGADRPMHLIASLAGHCHFSIQNLRLNDLYVSNLLKLDMVARNCSQRKDSKVPTADGSSTFAVCGVGA